MGNSADVGRAADKAAKIIGKSATEAIAKGAETTAGAIGKGAETTAVAIGKGAETTAGAIGNGAGQVSSSISTAGCTVTAVVAVQTVVMALILVELSAIRESTVFHNDLSCKLHFKKLVKGMLPKWKQKYFFAVVFVNDPEVRDLLEGLDVNCEFLKIMWSGMNVDNVDIEKNISVQHHEKDFLVYFLSTKNAHIDTLRNPILNCQRRCCVRSYGPLTFDTNPDNVTLLENVRQRETTVNVKSGVFGVGGLVVSLAAGGCLVTVGPPLALVVVLGTGVSAAVGAAVGCVTYA